MGQFPTHTIVSTLKAGLFAVLMTTQEPSGNRIVKVHGALRLPNRFMARQLVSLRVISSSVHTAFENLLKAVVFDLPDISHGSGIPQGRSVKLLFSVNSELQVACKLHPVY